MLGGEDVSEMHAGMHLVIGRAQPLGRKIIMRVELTRDEKYNSAGIV